ncbi:MAG: FMN-binding protein, partial [Bacillota bacterium]
RDGTYDGSHEVFPVSVEVRVTVQDHRITRIELVKHTHGRGEAAEVIPDRVLEAQTLKVDAISGATYSSKAILKAIEDALLKAGG